MTTATVTRTIPATIKAQIGTDALLAVSAREFDTTEHSLIFRFGPRHGLIRKVAITYHAGSDDYSIHAVALRRTGTSIVLADYSGVYADSLDMLIRDINNEAYI